MPYQPFDRSSLPRFVERLSGLSPRTERRWGTMTPLRLLGHLHRSFAITLGEVEVVDRSNLLMRTLGKWAFFYVFTNWPKGKIKAPDEFFPPDPSDFEAAMAQVVEIMDRFVAAAEADPKRRWTSPFLGPQTLRFAQRLHGLHTDHHLRQFGL